MRFVVWLLGCCGQQSTVDCIFSLFTATAVGDITDWNTQIIVKNFNVAEKTQNNDFFGAAPREGRGI